ncbi:M15 family metallopeptidase [Nocardioides sp. Leaf307]|uniref:M15 family metallopeptidase n=1 Tax=Nocardioides sp. Leaf307 TaxID=1736331 RepID=UPI000703369D|nr:M15 family metallopeptidase [Nocardioides sp. Leaf307]KQQ43122.1 hypothetical protein ASF50_03775 [Nocardioides sp. Leaf307]
MPSLLQTPLRLLVLLVCAALAGAALAALPATAARAPGLTVEAPARYADTATPLTATLRDDAGAPVAGAEVVVERRRGGEWAEVARALSDEAGAVVVDVVLARAPKDNVVRAVFAGDATHPAAEATTVLPLRKRGSDLRLGGPGRVVDERSVDLAVRWTTGSGTPVAGRVTVQSKPRGAKAWSDPVRVRTDDQGRASLTVRPRVDTVYRALAPAKAWLERSVSGTHLVDNRPPGTPVALPAGAPRPRISLPRQPRATGEGARPVVTAIPDGVWKQMTGRSWHAGCPVGRSGLRLLRINYWGFDGYRYRGELVAATGAVGQMAGALGQMYREQLPIRAMYRVDRFGWSKRLGGADDYASMAADNTSAFNCRDVVGRPGVRSPHSYGRSLDVNPWENPYRSQQGTVPNTWWPSRSHPRVAWRSSAHAVVSAMRAHGLRWTYGVQDAHHFDASAGAGRVVLDPRCAGVVCE